MTILINAMECLVPERMEFNKLCCTVQLWKAGDTRAMSRKQNQVIVTTGAPKLISPPDPAAWQTGGPAPVRRRVLSWQPVGGPAHHPSVSAIYGVVNHGRHHHSSPSHAPGVRARCRPCVGSASATLAQHWTDTGPTSQLVLIRQPGVSATTRSWEAANRPPLIFSILQRGVFK